MPNKTKTPSAVTLEAQSSTQHNKGNESMKNSIPVLDKSQLTMTSVEISELVGSRHSDVKRSIERLIKKEIIHVTPMAFSENINNLGFETKSSYFVFSGEIGKRDSIIVIAQLCPEYTAKIVDRWQELEAKINQPIKLPTTKELAYLLIESEEAKEKLQLENKELKPKAEFHDKVIATHDSLSLSKTAKTLGTGRNKLCRVMREHKWLRRNNEPYQDKIDQGLLDVKLSNWEHPHNGLQQAVTALVTGKGLAKLSKMLTTNA